MIQTYKAPKELHKKNPQTCITNTIKHVLWPVSPHPALKSPYKTFNIRYLVPSKFIFYTPLFILSLWPHCFWCQSLRIEGVFLQKTLAIAVPSAAGLFLEKIPKDTAHTSSVRLLLASLSKNSAISSSHSSSV